MRAKHQIEDLYPLSPVQHGILFHCLYAPDSPLYFVQKTCLLRGRLDVPAFERAWQRVVERHAVLRTAFVWEGLDEPVQVVHARAELLLHKLDWRRLPAGEQRERLDAYLETDRRQGFDLTAAPLMRMALIRLSDDAYKFVWSYHHVLLDGWCNAVVLGEVLTFYEAFSQGREVEPKRSRPFRDYIAWLQGRDLSQAEQFWREALRGVTAPTPLRVDQLAEAGRAPEQAFGEERAELTLGVTQALQGLARRHRLTMHTLVQGAWALLLHRYSGEAEVLFGEVVSGRPAELDGVETMVGLFINTLPVRVRVAPEARLVPWLKGLQEQQVELQQYEHSPLVKVQRWSEVPAGTPLFETLLAYENYPADASLQGRGQLRVEDYASVQAANYPLTVTAAPMPELVLHIKYDCARFEAETIRRMLGHLTTLLEGMADAPECRLADLPLLTDGERTRLLREWNQTAASYPRHQLITELFERQAERAPHLTALVCGEERLTYRELNRRADLLANYLRASGVGPEVLVGVCAGRTAELVVALLAVLKAGGAYVPLDPAYPAERLAFILADARVKVLLTQGRLVEGLPPHGAQVVRLDDDWPLVERAAVAPRGEEATPDNLAYVIYTSGSTGKPKGVAIAHASAVTLIHWAREQFDAEELSGVLFGTSIIFDLSVFELFVTLGSGGTVILAENALELPRLPAAAEVRLVNTVPSAAAELVRTGGVPETVRTVNLAGEPLTRKLVQQLYERTNAARVLNLYGPSEDTTYSTFDVVECDEQRGVTIGRPIANTRAYVLDERMQPVPVGVAGELYLAGEGLARGYLNRPALTAERFVPDPFSPEPGGRLYRTGDVARYLADGRLDFLGRADHQVKLRGFRIELGEIETALDGHPSVRQNVVVVREDVPGDKHLVAYVVAGDDAPASAELRGFLKQRLPDYMVPACFVLLGELPLTPNGKVDRKALPAPDFTHASEDTYEPPRTPMQELLAGVWAELLNVERVGLGDNFFDLGGHSLLATRLTSRLSQAVGVSLPLRAIFESPTLADLATAVERALSSAAGAAPAPPIERADRAQRLPLSFAQQRLWFLDQLEPDSPSYNIPAAVRLRGRLDVEALGRALDEIIRRHEALRTSFVAPDGRPAQIIAEGVSFKLATRELPQGPEAEREVELRRLASAEAVLPFDLRRAPLLRASLVKVAEEEHVLLLTMHHIVSDGWSMSVLVKEMVALYEAFSRGEASPLAELSVQYADYAVWQREWLGGGALEPHLAYWREHLRGAPPALELPTDYPRPPALSGRGASLHVGFGNELTTGLRRLSRREGATLFMVALAGVQALLARYSGQEEVVVGVPVAGRARPEVEGLVGFFVNTLALRGSVAGDPTFRELVRRARAAALAAYAHQEAPFERVVEAVGGEREGGTSPLFQVMFAWQNAPAGRADTDGLRITPENIESATSKFDLSLVLWEEGEGVGGYVEYSTDLYERETVERMGRHLHALLAAAAAAPDRRLSELQLLSGEETGGRQLAELFAPELAAADLSAEELEGIVMEINRALEQ